VIIYIFILWLKKPSVEIYDNKGELAKWFDISYDYVSSLTSKEKKRKEKRNLNESKYRFKQKRSFLS